MNDKKPAAGIPLTSSPIASSAFQGELVELVRKGKLDKLNTTRQPVRGKLRGDYVSVRNNTGSGLAAGRTLQVGDREDLTDLTNENLWFAGEEPTEESTEAGGRTKGFGILAQDTPNGEVVTDNLQVSGVCFARVDVTDETHAYADVQDGSTILHSAVSGPVHILWSIGTGEQTCAVVFGSSSPETIRLFELTEKLTLGGKAKAKQLRRIGTSKNFETFGDEFWVNDFRRDLAHWYGQYIAAPGYRGVCCLPTLATQGGDLLGSLSSTSLPFSAAGSSADSLEWQIVDLEYVAEKIKFTLTERMGYYAEGLSRNATVEDFYEGKDPGSVQHIHDPLGLFKGALPGAKGWAVRIPWGDGDPGGETWPDGQYVAVQCQSKAGHIRVTLDYDRDSEAAEEGIVCTLIKHWGTQQDVQEPDDEELEVWFEEDAFADAKEGDRITAVYDSEDDKYWAVAYDKAGASRMPVQLYYPRTHDNAGSNTSLVVTKAKYTNLAFRDSVGDLAAAGVENLYSSATDADYPVLKILKGGLWKGHIRVPVFEAAGEWRVDTGADIAAPVTQTVYVSAASTGTPHYHTVLVPLDTDVMACLFLNFAYKKPGGTLTYVGRAEGRVCVEYLIGGPVSMGVTAVVTEFLLNLDDDTEIYIQMSCQVPGSIPSTAGVRLGGNATTIWERVSAQVEQSTDD